MSQVWDITTLTTFNDNAAPCGKAVESEPPDCRTTDRGAFGARQEEPPPLAGEAVRGDVFHLPPALPERIDVAPIKGRPCGPRARPFSPLRGCAAACARPLTESPMSKTGRALVGALRTLSAG